MSTTPADVIAELREAMLDMADDAHMTADEYTADCAPQDDASQAEAWRQWCAAIRRKCIADAMREHLSQMAHLPAGSHGSTLLDMMAVANDADDAADAILSAAIADARETSPDSWTARRATIL